MIAFLFRGILRDKSRFLFPFSVVTMGVALVISLVGFMEGTMSGMIEMTANLDTGHLRLVNKPYYEEEHLRPLDRSLSAQKETREWLKNNSSNKLQWFPRIRWGAILDVPDEKGDTLSQTPVIGLALELKNPDSVELKRMKLADSLIAGNMPKNTNEMLMGYQLAESLGVGINRSQFLDSRLTGDWLWITIVFRELSSLAFLRWTKKWC